MPQDRRSLGPSPPLPHLRPRRLLRLFAQHPRHQALPCHQASGGPLHRAGRELALVLRGQDHGGISADRGGAALAPAPVIDGVPPPLAGRKRTLAELGLPPQAGGWKLDPCATGAVSAFISLWGWR